MAAHNAKIIAPAILMLQIMQTNEQAGGPGLNTELNGPRKLMPQPISPIEYAGGLSEL